MTDWETRYYEAEASHTEANGMLTAENERLRRALSDDKRDAARYRAIRNIFPDILADEAGISGVAFDYQLPMALIKDASEEELLDAVADAAAEMDAEEAPK